MPFPLLREICGVGFFGSKKAAEVDLLVAETFRRYNRLTHLALQMLIGEKPAMRYQRPLASLFYRRT